MRFSKANGKLRKLAKRKHIQQILGGKRKIYSFDITSGHSCPFAKDCKSMVVDGKVVDGPETDYRCFSASQEALYPQLYKMRQANREAIDTIIRSYPPEKRATYLGTTIVKAMPKDAGVVRIHVGGDFINQSHFDAWLSIALTHPHILFYAYTKSLPYWVNRIGMIPENFVLTASYGGRRDDMIKQYGLRSAKVVASVYEARKLGLPVDNDDSHASKVGGDFALVIHNVQPAGTRWARAIHRMRIAAGKRK